MSKLLFISAHCWPHLLGPSDASFKCCFGGDCTDGRSVCDESCQYQFTPITGASWSQCHSVQMRGSV
jgi:hypothetical protein